MPHKLPNNDKTAKLLSQALDLGWFFPEFTAADMSKYFLKSGLYRYTIGSTVIEQGEEGRDIYVVEMGSVTVSRVDDGQESILSVIESGGLFGHVGFLRGAKRSARVTAREDSHIFRLVYNDIKYLLIKNKGLGCHLDKFAMDRS